MRICGRLALLGPLRIARSYAALMRCRRAVWRMVRRFIRGHMESVWAPTPQANGVTWRMDQSSPLCRRPRASPVAGVVANITGLSASRIAAQRPYGCEFRLVTVLLLAPRDPFGSAHGGAGHLVAGCWCLQQGIGVSEDWGSSSASQVRLLSVLYTGYPCPRPSNL